MAKRERIHLRVQVLHWGTDEMEMVKKVEFSMKDEVVEPLLDYLRHMTQTYEWNPSTRPLIRDSFLYVQFDHIHSNVVFSWINTLTSIIRHLHDSYHGPKSVEIAVFQWFR